MKLLQSFSTTWTQVKMKELCSDGTFLLLGCISSWADEVLLGPQNVRSGEQHSWTFVEINMKEMFLLFMVHGDDFYNRPGLLIHVKIRNQGEFNVVFQTDHLCKHAVNMPCCSCCFCNVGQTLYIWIGGACILLELGNFPICQHVPAMTKMYLSRGLPFCL